MSIRSLAEEQKEVGSLRYVILLSNIPTLFMTSLIQSAGHKKVAFTVVFSRLLKFEFQLTIRTNISNENLNIYTERLTGRETYKREKMEVDRQTNRRERERDSDQTECTYKCSLSLFPTLFPPTFKH